MFVYKGRPVKIKKTTFWYKINMQISKIHNQSKKNFNRAYITNMLLTLIVKLDIFTT